MLALAPDLVVAAASPERAGSAAAISETGTELGGALGVAVGALLPGGSAAAAEAA